MGWVGGGGKGLILLFFFFLAQVNRRFSRLPGRSAKASELRRNSDEDGSDKDRSDEDGSDDDSSMSGSKDSLYNSDKDYSWYGRHCN